MNPDERKWVEDATALCVNATRQNVTLLMIRKQDQNGEADIVITNSADPALIAAMNGNYEPVDEES